MKKVFICIILFLGIALGLHAQNTGSKFSVFYSFGLVNSLSMSEYFPENSSSYTLAGVYEPHYDYFDNTPVLSVGADLSIGRRVCFGVDMSWNRIGADAYDGITGGNLGNCSINQFSLVPSVKVNWALGKRGKFYSGLEAGVTALMISNYDGASSFRTRFALGLIPIGLRLEVTKTGLYLFGEAVSSTRVAGTRVGLGYEF